MGGESVVHRGVQFTDRFVRELPGDPVAENRTRQVLHACYSRVAPTAVPRPDLVAFVPEVAALLDLDPASGPELADVLAGNRTLPGMVPYAACYGGHQFGHWAGQLGDGRAITLGEVVNRAGEVWELQLKGAGPTPYSRRADGRAVLRSSLRELVCSEAMFHLGIPTTRALSLVATGEPVQRDLLYDGHPRFEPGAVVCRVAPSFLRFGSYEIHAAREDTSTLRALVHFTLARFYPHHLHGEGMDIAGFFDEVARLTAWTVSEWMRVGFVHGVMNTDNMSILGLTIDYGPYGWLEPFDLDWTPNITDASGKRYRFGAQPQVALWNIAQLARALAPLVDDPETLRPCIRAFEREITDHYRHTMLRKLGLSGRRDTQLADDELLADLGTLLTAVETDMTLWFRRLADVATAADARALDDAYYDLSRVGPAHRAALATWLRTYLARAAVESDHPARRARMNELNPIYVARNYLVQEVIEVTEQGDRSALAELLDVLRHPYDERPGRERYARKRPEWARVKPGCSMLSCSS
ncbi:MAG: YdiU family protein [Deltaproteobacteria bacterium]|nr:YdiU family protein [Deltaproteobacteria bacterium]